MERIFIKQLREEIFAKRSRDRASRRLQEYGLSDIPYARLTILHGTILEDLSRRYEELVGIAYSDFTRKQRALFMEVIHAIIDQTQLEEDETEKAILDIHIPQK